MNTMQHNFNNLIYNIHNVRNIATDAMDLAMKAPKKITDNFKDMFVGGNNASDELTEKRGETPELPFASLEAAITFSCENYVGYSIRIYLMADIEVNGLNIQQANIEYLQIHGGYTTTKRKITVKGNINSHSRDFNIYKAKIVFENNSYICVDGWGNTNPTIIFEECEIEKDGTDMLIKSAQGGHAFLFGNNSIKHVNAAGPVIGIYSGGKVWIGSRSTGNATTINGNGSEFVYAEKGSDFFLNNMTFKGSFVGKKYNARYASRILTNGQLNSLPGTLEGICDDTSIAI